jgi:hypothetical protein
MVVGQQQPIRRCKRQALRAPRDGRDVVYAGGMRGTRVGLTPLRPMGVTLSHA